jgi:hypothetical protein
VVPIGQSILGRESKRPQNTVPSHGGDVTVIQGQVREMFGTDRKEYGSSWDAVSMARGVF